jgi:putative phosphoserine phosphatase/1-acylglycerol-3-phosphate O-acyltransferase
MTSLEQLLDAVAAAPAGAQIGAFFDFDGTIIDGYSAASYYRERLRRREVGREELGRLLRFAWNGDFGEEGFADFMSCVIQRWAGRPQAELEELGRHVFREEVASYVFPEACRLIQAHQRRGHTVVIASSATQFQVGPMAAELGVSEVLCTRIEVKGGLLTGRIKGRTLWGAGKAHAVQRFAAKRGIGLQHSFGYANGNEDAAFLASLGRPCAVNPRTQLARIAAERNWPLCRFKPRRLPEPRTVLRTLASYGAMAGVLAIGRGLGQLRGNWPEIAGVTGTLSGELALAAAGIRLKVTGEENLIAARPAVFIFNHQSGLDLLIGSTLLRNDFVGVVAKGSATLPGLGHLSRLAKLPAVDHADAAAVDALLAFAAEQLANGISIAIAPEGSSSPTPRPGPFLKAAFLMAMRARVPIVPVVLRNTGEVMWRNNWVMRPGTVEVAVLPPVAVEHWTTDSLEAHIAAVRQRFVDTLECWPGEVVPPIAARTGVRRAARRVRVEEV